MVAPSVATPAPVPDASRCAEIYEAINARQSFSNLILLTLFCRIRRRPSLRAAYTVEGRTEVLGQDPASS